MPLLVYGVVLTDQNYCMIEIESEYGNTLTCMDNISLPHEYLKQLC
jgi:hypothetical protein